MAGWPTRMPSAATCLALDAPTSTHKSCTAGAFSLPASSRRKWIAVLPMMPVTGPLSARIEILRPRAVAASLPPPPARGARIASPRAVEPQEALGVDLLDHEADFIRVGFQHHHALAGARQDRPSGAVGVARHLGGMRAHVIGPYALARHFKAGGAGRLKQAEQKIAVVLIHL